MATNEILPFATTNTGTNLLTQAEYAADAQRTTGHQPGIARSKLENKALRQTSLMAAGLAEFIADYQANNVNDSLTTQNISDYLYDAVQKAVFPTGTKLVFAQSAAPAGWTRIIDDSANNRMLRVVSTGGGGTGGTNSPILNDVVPSHSHSFTSGGASANHTHNFTTSTDGWHSHYSTVALDRSSGAMGNAVFGDEPNYGYTDIGTSGAGSHYHGGVTAGMSSDHTHSGTTNANPSASNWTPRYIDLILCQKN